MASERCQVDPSLPFSKAQGKAVQLSPCSVPNKKFDFYSLCILPSLPAEIKDSYVWVCACTYMHGKRHINYGLKISLLEKELVPSLSLTSPPQKTHTGPIYSLKTSLACKWFREKRHQPSVFWLKNILFEEQKLHTNAGFDAIAQTQWLVSWALPSLFSKWSGQQSLQVHPPRGRMDVDG